MKIQWNIVRLRHDAAQHRIDSSSQKRLITCPAKKESGFATRTRANKTRVPQKWNRFCDKNTLRIKIANRTGRAPDSLGTDLVEVE